mgnify:FL=1
MKYIWHPCSALGYSLEDVSKENLGWDLEAVSGSLTLRIEVKGLSGQAASIELTPNEYNAFLEHATHYRLCIVTGCLDKPSLTTCFYNLVNEKWVAESKGSKRNVTIKEKMAATIFVT